MADLIQIRQLARQIQGFAYSIKDCAEEIEDQTEPPMVPWDRDISDELATNPGPWNHKSLDAHGGWWNPADSYKVVTHVTVHHTLTHAPHVLAANYVKKWNGEGYGHPTMPYTLWVTAEGQVLLCVPLHLRLWHDHTGFFNRHLSIGMAGELHKYKPADTQMEAAARVCAWAIKWLEMPKVDGIDKITGHMDWIATACPGWSSKASGFWKPELYKRIEALL